MTSPCHHLSTNAASIRQIADPQQQANAGQRMRTPAQAAAGGGARDVTRLEPYLPHVCFVGLRWFSLAFVGLHGPVLAVMGQR